MSWQRSLAAARWARSGALVQVGSGDEVAIKVFRPELADDPELITRFVQERSALCGLYHPNLVRVHDLVIEGGSAAIVMDLVVGTDLRAVLGRHGTLPPAEATKIVSEVLSALAVVHAKGIVHRDIKPENILLGVAGEVRLTDFGIARLSQGPSLTRLSGLIGTPDYMAPELAEGHRAEPSADIYATGIVLYELLTGSTPFTGGHPVAVLRRHIEAPPPRPDGVPDELWDVVATMLDKDPEGRPTAHELVHRLDAIAPKLKALEALPRTSPEWNRRQTSPVFRPGGADKQEQPRPSAAGLRTCPAPGSHRRPRRPLALAAAALVAVVVVGATLAAVLIGGAAPAPTFTFPPMRLSSGLVANRTWSLRGAGDPCGQHQRSHQWHRESAASPL